MLLKVEKDNSFPEKVTYKQIHGKFPYKKYFEIRGLSQFGKYVVVVGNSEITDIDTLYVKNDNKNTGKNNIIINREYFEFKVKEVDIFAVNDIPLVVFKPL